MNGSYTHIGDTVGQQIQTKDCHVEYRYNRKWVVKATYLIKLSYKWCTYCSLW